MNRSTHSIMIAAAAAIVTFGAANFARADEFVYRKLVPSVVLIRTPGGGVGSGVLIDANRRLVATANHVLGSATMANVWFAQRDREGRANNDVATYFGGSNPSIAARVVERTLRCDLVLIELESLPPGAVAVSLSQHGPHPGQSVHVIGHSNIKRGAVFGYSSGQVRNAYLKRPSQDNPLSGQFVETSIPTNKGDSGGPVVNDRGELVAIVSHGTTGADSGAKGPFAEEQVVDISIDVAEIRGMMSKQQVAVDSTRKPHRLNPFEPSLLENLPANQQLQWNPIFNQPPNGHIQQPSEAKSAPSLVGGTWSRGITRSDGVKIRLELTARNDGTFSLVELDLDGTVRDSVRGQYTLENGQLTFKSKQGDLTGKFTWEHANRCRMDFGHGEIEWIRL